MPLFFADKTFVMQSAFVIAPVIIVYASQEGVPLRVPLSWFISRTYHSPNSGVVAGSVGSITGGGSTTGGSVGGGVVTT